MNEWRFFNCIEAGFFSKICILFMCIIIFCWVSVNISQEVVRWIFLLRLELKTSFLRIALELSGQKFKVNYLSKFGRFSLKFKTKKAAFNLSNIRVKMYFDPPQVNSRIFESQPFPPLAKPFKHSMVNSNNPFFDHQKRKINPM